MRDSATGGSYEIVGHLATGGMAELFLARARGGAGEYVVLKRILESGRRELVSMFLDEARLSSRLHHPNIARVLDVGRAGHSYFYTMEYVHGRNVREVLERLVELGRFLPLDAALTVLVAAAAGLHAAHEQRDRQGRSLEIVHRDVSPSNVMVAFDGAVKIVDFGVASAVDHVSETRSGVVKGKTGYLAPEQCTHGALDRRCDIFALGIVAHELLTRARLFRRRTEYETMHAIVHSHPPPPSHVRRELPPALDDIVMRMLEKNRGLRYPTAAAVQADLLALAGRLGVITGPAVLADAMHTLFGSCPEPWLELERHRQRAAVHVEAFDTSSFDNEPTDPDADAIDLAMAAMLEPTERTPGPVLPAICEPPPVSDEDADERRPTRRRPAATEPPPPLPPLAVGTLRPGHRSPLAPPGTAGFPSAAPRTLMSMVPPPPVTSMTFPLRDVAVVVAPPLPPPEPPEAHETLAELASVLEPEPAETPEPRLRRRAIAVLVGAAIGGAIIAVSLAVATC